MMMFDMTALQSLMNLDGKVLSGRQSAGDTENSTFMNMLLDSLATVNTGKTCKTEGITAEACLQGLLKSDMLNYQEALKQSLDSDYYSAMQPDISEMTEMRHLAAAFAVDATAGRNMTEFLGSSQLNTENYAMADKTAAQQNFSAAGLNALETDNEKVFQMTEKQSLVTDYYSAMQPDISAVTETSHLAAAFTAEATAGRNMTEFLESSQLNTENYAIADKTAVQQSFSAAGINAVETDKGKVVQEALKQSLDRDYFGAMQTDISAVTETSHLKTAFDVEDTAGRSMTEFLDSSQLNTENYAAADKTAVQQSFSVGNASKTDEELPFKVRASAEGVNAAEAYLNGNMPEKIVNVAVKESQMADGYGAYRQVAEQIMKSLQGRQSSEITMQLYPETLGKIDVKLAFNQGRLVIDILAASHETHKLLVSQSDRLIRSLALSNVEVSGVQVTNVAVQSSHSQEHISGSGSNQMENMGQWQEQRDGHNQEGRGENSGYTEKAGREQSQTTKEQQLVAEMVSIMRQGAYGLNYLA